MEMSVLAKRLVWKTVDPTLAGLRGRDDRMAACARMFARVPVRRVVAAAGAAALLTGPKMNPVCTDLDAVFALLTLRAPHAPDGAKMNARGVRRRLALTHEGPHG